MRLFRSIAFVFALCVASEVNAALAPNTYTSLGVLNVTSNNLRFDTDTLTVSGGHSAAGVIQTQASGFPDRAVFTFSDINIGAGTTITTTGTRPLVLLSQGDMTIASSFNLNGSAGVHGQSFASACNTSRPAGGSAGVDGFSGGQGGSMDTSCDLFPQNFSATAGLVGGGPGGGNPGPVDNNGGGGLFTTSISGSKDISMELIGGSGGGGGGGSDNGTDASGGGGGGGGGAIELGAIGTVTLSSVTANGGTGGNSAGNGGAGGGGSGGGMFVHGAEVTINGITATGGGSEGFGGGGGSIRLAPSAFSVGDLLPTIDVDGASGAENGLALLVPDLTTVPVSQSLTLTDGTALMPGGLTFIPNDVQVEGSFGGDGVIPGSLVNNGIIGPGGTGGMLTTGADYVQSASGTLETEIGGLLQGDEYDWLNIATSATLDGTLDVKLTDLGGGLFSPSLGDKFDILRAETIAGNFNTLSLAMLDGGLGWDINYLNDEFGSIDVVRLSVVSAVPAPSTAWLFGSALGLVVCWKRKIF